MNLIEWIRRRVGKSAGLLPGGSPEEEERNLLIADPEEVRRFKLREYGAWQSGDSDELLNFYSRSNGMDMNYEPWYFKNQRSYFWSVSATEDDVKRTHSGIPAAITYALSSILGKPTFSVGAERARAVHRDPASAAQGGEDPAAEAEEAYGKALTERLSAMLDESGFWRSYETQKTCTLYQGWGCWKISWDLSFGDHPYASYYKAEDVDFVMRSGRLVSVIFRDWYQDASGSGRYLVTETRTLSSSRGEDGEMRRAVLIETKAWRQIPTGNGNAEITEVADLSAVPALSGIEPLIRIDGFGDLLAYPCVFFDDDGSSQAKLPGRSIHAGRIDLYDDLDMGLSQASNAVGKSTPVEYFNTDFLERDQETGLPKMPHRYDRKYTSFHGGRQSDGSPMSAEPVQVTQPNINFAQYSGQNLETLKMILTGLLSPATLGIDVARQATAESQREKEKITLATRSRMIERETEVLKRLFSGMLCVDEYLNSESHSITAKSYDITIKFDEFADTGFETKVAVLGQALDNGNLSCEMYLDKLYGDSLSGSDYEKELEFLKTVHDPKTQMEMQQEAAEADSDPMAMMMQGMMGQGEGEEEGEDPSEKVPDPRVKAPAIGPSGGE